MVTHPLFDLSGQVALVTGASRGIGLASARALAQAGAQVMLCSHEAAEREAAAAARRRAEALHIARSAGFVKTSWAHFSPARFQALDADTAVMLWAAAVGETLA